MIIILRFFWFSLPVCLPNKDKLSISCKCIYIIHTFVTCVCDVCLMPTASKNVNGYGDQTSRLPKRFLEVAFAKSYFLNIFQRR